MAVEKENKKIDNYEKALLSFAQGIKAFRKGDCGKAVESFKELIEKYESEKELVDRAKTYTKICQEAKTKETMPLKTFDDYYEYAVYQMNRGNYQEALTLLQKALEEDPAQAKILYLLATTYQLLGEKEQSLEFLKKSIQKDKYFKILAQNDQDFEPLRDDKKFKILTKLA